MRNILALLLPAVILVAGCSDNATSNDTSGNGNTFSATVNGKQWSGTTTLTAVYVKAETTLNVTATGNGSGGSEIIGLTLNNVSAPGTFPVGGLNPGAASIMVGNVHYVTPVSLTNSFGEVKISQMGNGTIAGTFNFQGYANADTTQEKKEVTGSFNMQLLEY